MDTSPEHYLKGVDLDNCAKEPIHIIGKTQRHGVLVVCDAQDLKITQAGENTEHFFGFHSEELLQEPLGWLLTVEDLEYLKSVLHSKEDTLPREVVINNSKFLMQARVSQKQFLLDFEPLTHHGNSFLFQRKLTQILNSLKSPENVEDLSAATAAMVKNIFQYDRVMIYRFDEEWNGEVIAESKNPGMESWLGLHYPATDIPEQSRKLFLRQRVRMISDVAYHPAKIHPQISPVTGKPLDISSSGLRAVSPIHIEYLENMGVGASITAAIVVKGKLWGLIACHHASAKFLDFYQRESLRFIAQIFSTEITLLETNTFIARAALSENIRNQLALQLKQFKNPITALTQEKVKYTDLISCGGGAVYFKGKWKLNGDTPDIAQLESLLHNFLMHQSKSLFYTHHLSQDFREAKAYREKASGLLSLKISNNKFIFWFRPEVVQEVNWGGNPHNKAFYNEAQQRLSPRRSFEKWTQKRTGFSEKWQVLDLNMARSLRENISYVLLMQQREEIEALNVRLFEANKELELFSYGLSHDLRAPIRGLEAYLQILQEDHGRKLDENAEKLLDDSQKQIGKMNALIENILEYSRITHHGKLEIKTIDTPDLIRNVLDFHNIKVLYPRTTLNVQHDLPKMTGDRRMLFQLWSNLIGNAFKYSSKKENPAVNIGFRLKNNHPVFFVQDNGIGIHPEYKEKIFETFNRATGRKFEGTGIGLAIAKKIVEKHRGKIWVDSKEHIGSAFYFYLDALNK